MRVDTLVHNVHWQESPVHRLQALDALLGYTTKRKREVLEAVDTLRELWIINLLPERKLIRWVERPFGDLPEVGKRREELLILWHYEGEIKVRPSRMIRFVLVCLPSHPPRIVSCGGNHANRANNQTSVLTSECGPSVQVRYERFIDVLEGMCHDQLPEVKTKVLGTVSELLSTKAEQEQRLLGTICNKLGDPHPKVRIPFHRRRPWHLKTRTQLCDCARSPLLPSTSAHSVAVSMLHSRSLARPSFI